MGGLSAIQTKKDAAVAIIFVYGLNSQDRNRYDSIGNLEWCMERLPTQHTEAHIMVYAFEDLYLQSSMIGAVNKAAKNLLSELDGPRWPKSTSVCNELKETGDERALDPDLPVLFICRGFAGLVVKKALILAKSHIGPHSISQRVAGLIFLSTPHSDNIQIWENEMENATDLRHRNSRSWRATQTLETAEGFVGLTKDFQQLSALYMIIYFCDEDRPECSGATLLHSNCLWSIVSQTYPQRTKENHYILSKDMSAILSMAHVERATVGMRKVAASYKSDRICLENEQLKKISNAREKLPSTCTWVFDCDDYHEWTVADNPAILWLTGAAGTGKSMLASAIVDDLLVRRRQSDVIAYFFLEEDLGGGNSARYLLEVLCRQLLSQNAVPYSLLYSLFPEVDSPMSREAFQYCLKSLLENVVCQTRVVLVLDGLDEEKWIKSVVIDEVSCVNNSRHRSDLIRCLISSQDSCEYVTHRSHVRNISLNNEPGVQHDVLRFAESRLTDIYSRSADAKSLLSSHAKTICLRGQGIFLWVALVIEGLHHTVPLAELEKEVRSLPPTIDGLYQRILKIIPFHETEIARKVFAWLIAAHRPLKLPELVEALAIETDPQRVPGIGTLASWIWNTQCPDIEIKRICGPLIDITRKNTVRFRHRSVRRHLLAAGETSLWGTSMVEAHTLLAQTCLTLLTPKEDEDSSLRGLRRLPLRSLEAGCASGIEDYASTNWSFHYGSVESHNKRLVSTLHRSLTLTLHRDCKEFSLHEMDRIYQIETTTLRIAAFHGFVSLTRVSLDMGVSPNGEPCNLCKTPLALAAAGGHSKVVALLLQRGASTTTTIPGCGETALHLAAAYGSQETVKILLEDAKTDSDAGYLGRTPLHAAAYSGHLDIVKILMNHNVPLNAIIPSSGETALHLAASRGHLQTVKWLVEGLCASDKEIELCDTINTQRYHQAWIDLLVDPTSAQAFFWEGEDKLYAQESMNELESLCGRYADINLRTREGRTALHLAASSGYVLTVQFLLQRGADLKLADNNRYTALRLAAENGHLNVVDLLLTAGADFNSDFHELGATLKNVTDNGHDMVANLLTWHFFSIEVMSKPSPWPVLALATKCKQNTVRDTIRKRMLMIGQRHGGLEGPELHPRIVRPDVKYQGD